jgi:xylulokinase
MREEVTLGIDIGTSATKAVLARPDGRVVARAQRPHALSLPQPGWAEHDAEGVWWRDVVALCRELAPVAGDALAAICVSGIGPCVVPCDASLRPLRPAILYGIDTRASAEVDELERRYGADAILARGGSALSSQALGPKLLWLRRREPQIWERTAGWYMASSFVAARLTGAYVLDHHSASQCDPLYDLTSGTWADWAEEVADGVPLPELVWPAEPVGTVTRAAADETGVPAGSPVMAGTIDAWAEAFSVGVRRPGDLMLMYGSTMFFVQVGQALAPQPLLWRTQGVEPGRPSLAAGMSTAGSLTDWLRTLFGGAPWDELVEEAAAVPPGARGLLMLPYFAGERTPIYDPLARGVLVGLTLGHGRAELLRAAYESTAFAARQILALLTQAADAPTRAIAVGGGTSALLWPQIVSDATGLDQHIPKESIGAAFGDALLAAIGAGLVSNDTDWASIRESVQPERTRKEFYDEQFALFDELYVDTADIVHRIAGCS